MFVIDTSGSLFTYAWPTVPQNKTQVLDIYLKVKGIQVMNDMGELNARSSRSTSLATSSPTSRSTRSSTPSTVSTASTPRATAG